MTNINTEYLDVPTEDSAEDSSMRDVMGKKSDTVDGNSVIALLKKITCCAVHEVELKTNTLDGSDDYNLFQITGVVQIDYLWGHVTTVLPAATTASSLQVFPTGGAAVQITSIGGTALSSLPVGSLISKDATAGTAIGVKSSALGFVYEPTGFIFAPFSIGQKLTVDTFIRHHVTEGNSSGAIHWHCKWTALTEGATVTPVV